MADTELTVLQFSPQVKEFVAKAMQNKTGVAMLRPDLLPDPKRTEPFTKYDLSEFYQLRIACVRGIADKAAAVYDIKKEEAGRVCDAVLVAAADQMKRGVPVDDPTNLLAPYLVSQQNRGYTNVDSRPEEIAMLGARVAADISSRDTSTEDKVRMYDIRPNIKPEMQPKGVAKDKPLLFASLKGGAKDAAFTAAVAYKHLYNQTLPETLGQDYFSSMDDLEKSAQCSQQGTEISRKECARRYYAFGTAYNLQSRASSRSK